MPVEVIADRDQTVTFTTQFASYNAGESAAFTVEEAANLGDLGVIEPPPPPPPPQARKAKP